MGREAMAWRAQDKLVGRRRSGGFIGVRWSRYVR
ncbi:hypothetical protein E2C01_094141 [Portunus trituberculatus]|uniref:Uncharacterized protein n=1 Tax=Portunus trituberculatus TaxID=210409 RepID=A0A5B7JPM8_PORTR|nr:hypothetical protein [Portunus trituberculatus]